MEPNRLPYNAPQYPPFPQGNLSSSDSDTETSSSSDRESSQRARRITPRPDLRAARHTTMNQRFFAPPGQMHAARQSDSTTNLVRLNVLPTTLEGAVDAHDLRLLRRLLRSSDRSTIDLPGRDQLTPLTLASRLGHSDTVKVLLRAGANPNTLCGEAREPTSALTEAIRNKHTEVVEAFLEQGALASADTEALPNPLHLAFDQPAPKRWELIQLLLDDLETRLPAPDSDQQMSDATSCSSTDSEYEIFPDNRTAIEFRFDIETGLANRAGSQSPTFEHLLTQTTLAHPQTLLQRAVEQRDLKLVRRLLELHSAQEQGGGIALRQLLQNHGRTPRQEWQHTTLINELLTSDIAFDQSSGLDDSLLLIAIEKGLTDIAKKMIQKMLPHQLNQPMGHGQTPVLAAIAQNRPRILTSLLKAGANLTQTTTSGNSPLHQAILMEANHLISLLLAYDPPMNQVNHLGYTPLHLAASIDNPEAIRRILRSEHGRTSLERPVEDMERHTPLQLAVVFDFPEVVNALLEGGANSAVLSELEGKNLLDLALESHAGEVFQMLMHRELNLPQRMDTENSHDSHVTHQLRSRLEYLQSRIVERRLIPLETLVQELNRRIGEGHYPHAAHILDTMIRTNITISHLSSEQTTHTECSVLQIVFTFIHSRPEPEQSELMQSLLTQLNDGYDTETNHPFCPPGRVNRVLHCVSGILPEFEAIVTLATVQHEMLGKAAHLRSELVKEQGDDVVEALYARHPTDSQDTLVDFFQGELVAKLRTQLREDYVDSGILSDKEYKTMIDAWINLI